MRLFEEPIIEVQKFDVEEVITASTGTTYPTRPNETPFTLG